MPLGISLSGFCCYRRFEQARGERSMIVVMKRNSSQEELNALIARIERDGARPIVGQAIGSTKRTV